MIQNGAQISKVGAASSSADQAGLFRGEAAVRFGNFVLKPFARTLLFQGRPVELGSRAFDLLVVLLGSQGGIVTKEEIIRYVWPTTVVDESNLRFQMATLRRALGKWRDLIKTVPGRGYLFIADPDNAGAASNEEPGDNIDPFQREPSERRPAVFLINEDVGVRNAICKLLRRFDVEVEAFSSLAAAAMGSQRVGDGSADCMERPTL